MSKLDITIHEPAAQHELLDDTDEYNMTAAADIPPIPDPKDGRDIIYLTEIDDETGEVLERLPDDVSDDVYNSFVSWNEKTQSVFRRQGDLFVLKDVDDTHKIAPLKSDAMGGMLSRSAEYRKYSMVYTKRGPIIKHQRVQYPPKALITDVFNNHDFDQLPILHTVLNHPVLTITDDGEYKILFDSGYNKDIGVFISPITEFNYTKLDKDGIKEVIDDVYGSFSYKKDKDGKNPGLSNTLAYALTFLVKDAIKGTSARPVFITTSPGVGMGKTFNTEVTLTGLLGRIPATTNVKGKTENDIAKLVYSEALEGSEYMVLDNIGSEKLDTVAVYATASRVNDRMLGVSKNNKVDNHITFALNGINIDPGIDIVDRSVLIEFETDVNAANRKDKHVDLKGHILKTRDKYLSALISMIDIWIEEGCQMGQHKHRMASWAQIVGGILNVIPEYGESFLHCIQPDLHEDAIDIGIQGVYNRIDSRTQTFATAWALIAERVGVGKDFTVGQVFTLLSFEKSFYTGATDEGNTGGHVAEKGDFILGDYINTSSNHDSVRKIALNKLLMKESGTIYGKYKLVYRGIVKKTAVFRMEEISC